MNYGAPHSNLNPQPIREPDSTARVFGVFQRPNPAEFRFPGLRKGNWGGKLVPETTQQYGGLLEVKIIVKTPNREMWVYIMNHNEDIFVTSARMGLRPPFGCLCYPGVTCNNTPKLQGRRRVFKKKATMHVLVRRSA